MIFLKAAPAPVAVSGASEGALQKTGLVLGLRSNVTFSLLAGAAFLCCIPMAMPTAHLIALCGDLGMAPARGALMLSVLLVCAFLSRQFWGWLSDRIGGLMTLIIGSGAQAAATVGFIFTQDEAGLFAVAAAFGLGFAGLIPAYILTARQYFPAQEASWRVPTVLLTGMSGMAAGSWMGGVIYDYFGFYVPAFVTGLVFHLVNFAVILFLLMQSRRAQAAPAL